MREISESMCHTKRLFFLDTRDLGTGSTLLLAVRLKLTYLYFKRGDPYPF